MVKQVAMAGGHLALVDDDDYEAMAKYRWRLAVGRYAQTTVWSNNKGRELRMHRLLMNPPTGMEVDHINGDGLDNRRSNLRLATTAQNRQNRQGPGRNSTTGVLGVTYHVRVKKYVGQIHQGKKNIFYRYFDTLEEAATAVKEARRQLLPYSQEAMGQAS